MFKLSAEKLNLSSGIASAASAIGFPTELIWRSTMEAIVGGDCEGCACAVLVMRKPITERISTALRKTIRLDFMRITSIDHRAMVNHRMAIRVDGGGWLPIVCHQLLEKGDLGRPGDLLTINVKVVDSTGRRSLDSSRHSAKPFVSEPKPEIRITSNAAAAEPESECAGS